MYVDAFVIRFHPAEQAKRIVVTAVIHLGAMMLRPILLSSVVLPRHWDTYTKRRLPVLQTKTYRSNEVYDIRKANYIFYTYEAMLCVL